jgi:DNA-binding NarL/FixJ family response regulator
LPEETPKKIRVFIADDSVIIRERLVSLLAELDTVQIVGQAERIPALLASIPLAKPDVVILDIRMPGGSGVEALKSIKLMHPSIQVIILTHHSNPEIESILRKEGADYFFDKARDFERIVEVLRGLRD